MRGLAPSEACASTLIAAHKTGRRARVCELDPIYCDRILHRWEIFAKDDAELSTGNGTIGGTIMANLSGPRRIKAGAARDFVLGVKAVSGRGEAFKAGGRVVKNVTGYDLSRGLAGSFGTLAIATEVTLKVLPRGETSATLILTGLDPAPAVTALCAAMGAPIDVSGAAHLPPFAAKTQGYSTSITALRLEGFAPSVAGRLDRLEAMLKDLAPMARTRRA